jgi:hypothetical protein
MGALRGAAIRLYEPDHRLAIAEGVESALAVRLLTGWPVWSGIAANFLADVEVPASVREVSIWADSDAAGMKAALRLRDRLAASGKRVQIIQPRDEMDPLDVYLAQQAGAGSLTDLTTIIGLPDEPPKRKRLTDERCRCASCGEHFNSTGAFDEHRTGDYGKNRRCLTSAEMQKRGMRLSAEGWWLTSK